MMRVSLLVITLSLMLVPAAAFADITTSLPDANITTNPQTQTPAYTGTGGGQAQVTNPLGNINSFCGLIKAILSAVVAIGIPIAVLFIVFAGFKFVLAQGNPAELKKARDNLLYTLIGIGIFLGAWLLAMVIANTINTLSAGSTSGQAISCK
jgi:hypothetical protein